MQMKKYLVLASILVPLLSGLLLAPNNLSTTGLDDSGSQLYETETGEVIEVKNDEVLRTYSLSEYMSLSGNGDPLSGTEFGIRTDSYSGTSMSYIASSNQTTSSTLPVSLGDDWIGHSVTADISNLEENRTWLQNYNFGSDANWMYKTANVASTFLSNNTITVFSSTGTNLDEWGSRGTSLGQFDDAYDVAVSADGYIFISDRRNHRIQVFNSKGIYAHSFGSFGTGNGEFDRPSGIDIDASGNVYVVDLGNDRIQVFNLAGTFLRAWGTSGRGNGQFYAPSGVAVSGFNSYVYVTDTGNSRVQYFTSTGTYVGQFGSYGTGTGNFDSPTGIDINNSNGEVIVSDTSNCRVKRHSATGTYQSYVGLYSARYGSGSNGYFRNPQGVAVASNGTIFVNDAGNNRVQYFSSTGTYQGRWGSTGTTFEPQDLIFNYGIEVNGTGHVIVSEAGGIVRSEARYNPSGYAEFGMEGYYYYWDKTAPLEDLYGFWYNEGDKAYIQQDLNIDRGDITWMGISLRYYADNRGWTNYMTGFFEAFVGIDDPDDGGSFLWRKSFDAIADDNVWYSTGLVEINPSSVSLPEIHLTAGLRVTAFEWWRIDDIRPYLALDDIIVYVKAKVAPSQINLEMHGEEVTDTASYGEGASYYEHNWYGTAVYGNFTWWPIPTNPDPNLDISITFDVALTAYAKRYSGLTISDTDIFTEGDYYLVSNGTNVSWETNYYVAVPGGYSSRYNFSLGIPTNRDITHVGQPTDRFTNLSSGWYNGEAGDEYVNISAYAVTLINQNGFWLFRSTSPNMIENMQIWDTSTAGWLDTHTFRAGEDTRFMTRLSPVYAGDTVNFTVYDASSTIWIELQASVNSTGYAVTDFVNLDAFSASVGEWYVQASVVDAISSGAIHNAGFFSRLFSIEHATSMSVKYPFGSETSWTENVTYGDLLLLQVRVNDTDNGALLSGGILDYSWSGGSGSMSDLGTGEYSVTLDTADLPSNGQYDIDLTWTKDFYDTILETFTVNVIYTTDLFSPDAPGVDVPLGSNAQLTIEYKDQTLAGIDSAAISCNWTLDDYTVTPDGGTPGKYTLDFETDAVTLGTYVVEITASKDFFESRTILLSIQVRELFTSAIPSTSFLSLPVGYTTSFTITYRDTDHNTPISGAANIITCNWSAIHSYGDLNYTVAESATPGVYDIDIYSSDLDILDTYSVVFNIRQYGVQNHTFTVTVELRTHLTSFYLVNSVDPTPYTGDINIYVRYFDTDANVGIENGSAVGYNVLIEVNSDSLPGLLFSVENGTEAGEYIIVIRADQWGAIGSQTLHIYANWTGPTVKYSNETIDAIARIIAAPTDIFIGESPVMTPYGENATFSIIYYDIGNDTGIVNGTGPFMGNVLIYVEVLTAGQSLTQQEMVITEIDFINSPGEYQFEFNTSYLSGIIGCELRIWFNWTKGVLPYYANQSLQLTVYSTYRLTTVEWTPLPLTAYDELVNLSLVFKDVLSSQVILNASSLSISVPTYGFDIFYDGDTTGIFLIEVDTSSWAPGQNSFLVTITWDGSPYYQNRTVSIKITTRYRYTELVHGSYAPVQFRNNITITFSYRDLDDYTTLGMNGGTLTLDASLSGFYDVFDNGDGTYAVRLNTTVLVNLGVHYLNATIVYGGIRYCNDAYDSFYISVVPRRTQLTSDLPDLAPYLTLANITVTYLDDTTGAGIEGANVYASCATSIDNLEIGVNYWVYDLGAGEYQIRIATTALGTFGSYSISITVNWTGSPYYTEKNRAIAIEVSRRESRLLVTTSPLNTPFLENVTFEFTATDGLTGSSILLDKSHLTIRYGPGVLLADSLYALTYDGEFYQVTFESAYVTSTLIDSLAIGLEFFWGDTTPYYSNATTSTQVTITGRNTQTAILSTPPASYGFNMTAIISYSDFLTGDDLSGASISVLCLNVTPIESWWFDRGDGTYSILVNSSGFANLGRYFFLANITWNGSPYYRNRTNVAYSILLNPVATILTLELTGGSTNYLGDVVYANVTYKEASTGIGIEGANITSNWTILYGSFANATELGNGVYRLLINTSGLNAQNYPFDISASKYRHVNKTVDISILLAAIPVNINIATDPEGPIWGDLVVVELNITNARTGVPVELSTLNATIAGNTYYFSELGSGIYQTQIPSILYPANEYALTIMFEKTNHETREIDSQLRIAKVPSVISADLTPFATVNGDSVIIYAEYLIQSNNTPIEVGTLSYSWIGGTGLLTWSTEEGKYIGQFTIVDIVVGSHKILVQASSTNYRSVNTQVTLEINVINTDLVALDENTVIQVVANDEFNITVYLNNTDLSLPVTGASLTYSIGDVIGNMTETGNGYYTVNVSSIDLEIRNWILTVSSSREGFAPSSLQFTIIIKNAPTEILILTNTQLNVYYGQNATFRFVYWDKNFEEGVPGADGKYLLSLIEGNLTDYENGTYVLEIDTTLISASSIAYQIAISFQKDGYDYANAIVRLLVNPIPTTILGAENPIVPWGDDYTQGFSFYDELNDEWILDAIRTVFWQYGTTQLLDYGNGTYYFSPSITDRETLLIGEYELRIVLTKANYERAEILVNLTIRPIRTMLIYERPDESAFSGQLVIFNLTYWDLDHNVPILGAINSTDGTDAERIAEEEYQGSNGTYFFYFRLNEIRRYEIIITLSSSNYDDAIARAVIFAVATEEQIAARTAFTYGALGMVIFALFGALWIKVLSVPKMLRWIRSMMSTLAKGKIPTPKPVRSRQELLHSWINDEFENIGLRKSIDDISKETIQVDALDTDRLLAELAVIIGLTESDVAALERDLDKMKPSERGGFLNEVIRQERARRAKELSESIDAVGRVEAPAAEKLSETDLADLKDRLLKMGIEETEADLMVEQARNLSKAEIEALLDQIGGMKE